MNKIDTLYRAYKDYLKQVSTSKEIVAEFNNIAHANEDLDVFEATKYLCVIEEDWVEHIEKGMEFIEKAVAEQRQFIRTNGEVVPIEKVRKVSRDSVEHLAKHSGLITHVPEDEKNIVPDQLYMVEKLSDYAVYENRFLYMLLCYLRDFITYRLDKIEKLRMTYHCNLSFNKEVESKKRKLKYTVTLQDDREDNIYPISDEKSKGVLKRINDCAQVVNSLLNTDLMTQVAKSPMIKPPIVKTNVLKMNNNFKNALALYDYVATYKGDGYTSQEIKTDFVPLKDTFAQEFASIPSLLTFISYEHGNNIEDILEQAYQEEERRLKDEEARKIDEQLAKLKKRAADGGKSLEEYMLLLEKRLRILEKDSEEIGLLHQEIEGLNRKINEIQAEKKELLRKIEELNQIIEEKIKEIAYLNQKYIEDMAALRKQHAEEIERLNAEHEMEMIELSADYENQIYDLNDNYLNEINSINERHENEINELNESYQSQINKINEDHENEVTNLLESHHQEVDSIRFNYEEQIHIITEEKDAKINELTEEFDEKVESIRYNEAQERDKLYGEFERKSNELEKTLEALTNKHEEMVSSYDSQVEQLKTNLLTLNQEKNDSINEYEARIVKLETDYNNNFTDLETRTNKEITDLNYKINLLEGQIMALGIESGEYAPNLDFSSQEKFEKLELEFEAFNRFFKEQWKITKKAIRKELLWTKDEKAELNKQFKEEDKRKKKEAKEKMLQEQEQIRQDLESSSDDEADDEDEIVDTDE